MAYSVLRLPEVRTKCGLSTSTIYQRIRENSFPKPISLGNRAVGFIESEIDDWIELRIAVSRSTEDFGS